MSTIGSPWPYVPPCVCICFTNDPNKISTRVYSQIYIEQFYHEEAASFNLSLQLDQFRLPDDFLGYLGIAGEVVQKLRVVHTFKFRLLSSLSH